MYAFFWCKYVVNVFHLRFTEAICNYLQIQEIVTTGKLSKLEHFERDEKVLQRSSVELKFYYHVVLKAVILHSFVHQKNGLFTLFSDC